MKLLLIRAATLNHSIEPINQGMSLEDIILNVVLVMISTVVLASLLLIPDFIRSRRTSKIQSNKTTTKQQNKHMKTLDIIDQITDTIYNSPYNAWSSTKPVKSNTPPYDLHLTKEAAFFDIPLAGVEKEDISITATDNQEILVTLKQKSKETRDYVREIMPERLCP